MDNTKFEEDPNVNHILYNKQTATYTILLNNISDDDNYNALESCLYQNYMNKEYFNVHVETKNLEKKKIKMSYLYKLASFLKKLKQEPNKYLMKTKINVYDDFTNNLLYTLFTYLSSPIAPVEIVYYKTRTHNNDPSLIRKVKYYFPHNI